MRIGILDESVIKKIAADILMDRPEIISVFVEGTNLIIESVNIDSLVEFLEREHGLHLIVNGDSYMIASQMNEGLAQIAANAGKMAADAASGGLVGKTQEFMKKKREEVGEPTTDAELDADAEEEARNSKEEDTAEDDVIEKFRDVKAMSKEMNPETMKQRVVNSKEIQKMIKHDPKFVQILRDMIAQSEDDEDDGNLVSLPSGEKLKISLAADVNRDSEPILEEK